jgi:hypothetical protein
MDGLIKAFFAWSIKGVTFAADTAIWALILMIAPAPFIFGGLLEISLDYNVILYLNDSRHKEHLQALRSNEQVHLLTAILAGNLDIEDAATDPQKDLESIFDFDDSSEWIGRWLTYMLSSRYSLGASVGLSVADYITLMIAALVDMHNAGGYQNTARTLVFGVWWMTIAHVAIVKGCLLASDDPRVSALLAKDLSTEFNLSERLARSEKSSQTEDSMQARLGAWFGLIMRYRTQYKPAWMWARGWSKLSWLQRTSAWARPTFRERVELTARGWILLVLLTSLLSLSPCALAFWIEYSNCDTNGSSLYLTLLVYGAAQLIIVVLTAWSQYRRFNGRDYLARSSWLDSLSQKPVKFMIEIFILLSTWLTATLTTLLGVLVSSRDINDSGSWPSTLNWDIPKGSKFALAAHNRHGKQSNRQLISASYTALTFLGFVACFGCGYQWVMRRRLQDCIDHASSKETAGSAEKNIELHKVRGIKSRRSQPTTNTEELATNTWSNSNLASEQSLGSKPSIQKQVIERTIPKVKTWIVIRNACSASPRNVVLHTSLFVRYCKAKLVKSRKRWFRPYLKPGFRRLEWQCVSPLSKVPSFHIGQSCNGRPLRFTHMCF